MPNARVGAAVRFAVAIAVVNVGAYAVFGTGTAATAASFATISVLYFLDFDGTARERLQDFALSTLVATAGLVAGALVQGNVVAIGIAAYLFGHCFAVARAYRGLVARSFVGAQLGFVLAIFTADAAAGLPALLGGWLLGTVLAVAVALTVFPRQHSGQLRRAIAAWCRAAADALRAPEADRPGALTAVLDRDADLTRVDPGQTIAGLWSPRTRALAAMQLLVGQLSDFARLEPVAGQPDRVLVSAVADALERAAEIVLSDDDHAAPIRLDGARASDLDECATRLAADVDTDRRSALSRVADELDVRVLSIGAESMQMLAAASWRRADPDTGIAFVPRLRVADLLRRALSPHSVWLRNGIRTGVATAAAAVIATLLGVEHGVWVAMAALSVVNVTFSAGGTARRAQWTLLGAGVGVFAGAAIIGLLHQRFAFFLLVPLLAGAAKWYATSGGFAVQLTYTPFAIANTALLGWPSAHGLSVIRLQDIAIGVVVAIVATVLAFPFGLRGMLERAWHDARAATIDGIDGALRALRAGQKARVVADSAQARMFAEHTDSVRAALVGSDGPHEEAAAVAARQRWLSLGLLCRNGIASLPVAGSPLPAAVADIVRPVEDPLPFADLVRADLPVTLVAEHSRAVVGAVWASRAADLLRLAEPAR